MRILYVAHQYDYGRPEQGYCFEHYNFYGSLVDMGHELEYFDYPTIAATIGIDAMNRRLRERVDAFEPDLMFTVVWGDDTLQPATVEAITGRTPTTTLNWYCDDHWRFDSLSRRWTPCFDHVVTTSQAALPRYTACGFTNVIKSQWAANPAIYRPVDHSLDQPFDEPDDPAPMLSFVGLPHGHRARTIRLMHEAGLPVHAFGKGWPAGRVDQDAMVRLFARSRINLNFAEASSFAGPAPLTRRLCEALGPRLRQLPGLWRLDEPMRERLDPGRRLGPHLVRQIKGRVFEVPACGGFLLTGDAENLRDYYKPGRDIVTFDTLDDLIDKARHYLDHDDQRRAIARAGYERTLAEHTYRHRFGAIFRRIGLPGYTQDAAQAA